MVYLKEEKTFQLLFFKRSTFYNIIFFHYAVDLPWHEFDMNFSCPGSKFWLDDQKVLGFCGVLYSETFKALWGPRPPRIQDLLCKNFENWKNFILLISCPPPRKNSFPHPCSLLCNDYIVIPNLAPQFLIIPCILCSSIMVPLCFTKK